MAEAALALGANLDDPARQLAEARRRLVAAGIAITRASSLHRTPPWGPVAQGDFLNQCLMVETDLEPIALLRACLAIEEAMGRTRGVRWGPRRIDIDLLTYDAITLDLPELTLPHPRLLERAFVLVPLAEIAPDLIVDGVRIADALQRVDRSGIEKVG